MEKKYSFEDLVRIVEILRSEHGCPWDKVQTHESLRPCMVEEAYELLGAIRIYKETGNAENLQEELGDILLQSVMHSVIAKEENLFAIEDVIGGISEKMIRRHPHIFAEDDAQQDTQTINQNWEEMKKKEKEGQSWVTSALQEIPKELPSLTRGTKLQKKLDQLPEYYEKETNTSTVPQTKEILAMMKREIEQMEKNVTEESVALLLRCVCQLSYRHGFAPEQILYDDIENIIAKNEV